jgi:hypothetical protein
VPCHIGGVRCPELRITYTHVLKHSDASPVKIRGACFRDVESNVYRPKEGKERGLVQAEHKLDPWAGDKPREYLGCSGLCLASAPLQGPASVASGLTVVISECFSLSIRGFRP